MRYSVPSLHMISSVNLSTWCSKGSGGELADNSCIVGNNPETTQCQTGNTNSSGHCIGGSSVSNDGAGIFCGSGSGGGFSFGGCTAGPSAVGYRGCNVGTTACHCENGSGA